MTPHLPMVLCVLAVKFNTQQSTMRKCSVEETIGAKRPTSQLPAQWLDTDKWAQKLPGAYNASIARVDGMWHSRSSQGRQAWWWPAVATQGDSDKTVENVRGADGKKVLSWGGNGETSYHCLGNRAFREPANAHYLFPSAHFQPKA